MWLEDLESTVVESARFQSRVNAITRTRGALLLCSVLLLSACQASDQRNPLAADWQPSPNFGPRLVSLVVLHHTDIADAETAIATLRDPARAVSAHYLISRTGRVIQQVDEHQRAWHAGRSRWGAITDVNSASVGIELDNNGAEPFADAQVQALFVLLDDLRTRFHLTPLAFVGHADVAPGRKVDPSVGFPWRDLAQRGFGLWCDPPLLAAPAGFDVVLGLQALGYDVTAPDAAADAFALHYVRPPRADAALRGAAALDPALVSCLVQRARGVVSQQ